MGTETRILGDGAYGTVFSNNKQYAIKQIKQDELSWIKEVFLTKYLNHPNIIKFISIQSVNDYNKAKPFSKTKRDYIHIKMKKYECLGKLRHSSDREIMIVLRDISRALAHCQTKKILHRDIKEDNILIEFKDGKFHKAHLIDFGLACLPILDIDLSGNIVTPTHRPPEIPEKSKYDYRVDTWGFGMVIVFLVTGHEFLKYTELSSEEFIKLTKNREKFLKKLQNFIDTKCLPDLKHRKFYAKLINMCIKPYDSRMHMAEIHDIITKFIEDTKIDLPKEEKYIMWPVKQHTEDQIVAWTDNFSINLFNMDKWIEMEDLYAFINDDEREDLKILIRIFLKLMEVKLFFINTSTDLIYSAIYMLFEMTLIDYTTEVDIYVSCFRKSSRKFEQKKILETVLSIINITDNNVLDIMQECYAIKNKKIIETALRKKSGQTLSAPRDTHEDC